LEQAQQATADVAQRVESQVRVLVAGEWDPYGREKAIEALGAMGPEAVAAVPYILQAVAHAYELDDFVDDRDIPGIPSAARSALARIGPDALKYLIDGLSQGDDLVRLIAAESLGDIGPPARDAIPALMEALKRDGSMNADPKSALEVPGAAVRALARIGASAVPALVQLLRSDGKLSHRLSAASALREMGPVGREAVPALVAELQRASDRGGQNYRQAVIEALGAMGPSAREAVPLLNSCLQDQDAQTREIARRALESIQRQ
jgi:HEAT repeat protein